MLTGAAGPAGPDGPAGPAGPSGPAGAAGAQGIQGIQGIQGPQGFPGTNGTNGTNGVSGWERIPGTASADDENAKTAVADCTAGKRVVGGGYVLSGQAGDALTENVITSSHPVDDDTWQVVTRSAGTIGGDHSFAVQAFAICATVQP